MTSKLKLIARKCKSLYDVKKGIASVTFSQFCEDVIMIKMLERHNVKDISYLDIGANDPINGSNTYNLYLRGYRGVLIEPNSILCDKIKKIRPGDKCLNIGISIDNQADARYYMFSDENCAMNTFSKEEADNYEKEGFPVKKVITMPLKAVNDVLAEHFTIAPTILSIDVEGMDELILSKLDFNKYHPLLVCVETVKFNKNKAFDKRTSILELMSSKGYFIYADTHVNTIFCSKTLFDNLCYTKNL